MAAPSYYPADALLQSMSLGYGNEPVMNEKLIAQYLKAVEIRNKLVLGFDATQAKRELAQLAAEQKLYDSVNSTIKSILETKGKDSRVTSQNFTDLKETKDKVDAQLALKLSAPTPPWASADAAYTKTGGKTAGAPAIAAAADALVKWTDPMGKGVDASYSEIAPLMNRYSILALRKPLDQVKDPQELIDAMGNVAPSLRESFGQLARAGWTRYNDINGLLKQNQADKEWFGESAARFQAGVATADDLTRLRSMAQELGPRLIEATGRDAADVAMQRQLLLEENDRIKQADAEVEELRSLIFKTKADPFARLVASEQFQEWARMNGYDGIGVATVGPDGTLSYVPGDDDADAIYLYNWQAQHPGRYSPMRRVKPTGALVRVTVQDPKAREAVIKEYRGVDGKMYMANGELVKPAEAQQALIDGGFVPSVEYAEVGGKSYLRTPDGRVIDVATGETTTDTVDAKAFKPALYYDNATGSVRYLTPSDVDTAAEVAELDRTPGEGEIKAGMGVLEDSDKAAIAQHVATSTIKPVTEDEVRGKWTGVYQGRLDSKLASDIVGSRRDVNGKAYGPNAISLDGGAVVIPGDVPATIEILKVDNPGVRLGDIAKGWRQRMSAREIARISDGQNVPVGTASPNLPDLRQREIDTKTAARLADVAAAEFVGQPPPVVEPKMVTVTSVGSGGTVETATVPADSAAARIAVATGKKVEDVGPEPQRYETSDGKVYEVKADGSATLVKGAAAGEKISWTPDELAGDTALVGKLQADTTRNVSAPSGVEVPGMPALPKGVDVSRYGSRAVVRYPGQPAEPSFLERVGAGAAELVGDIKELPARMRGGGAAGAGAAGAGAGAAPAGAAPSGAGAAPAGGQAPAPGAAPAGEGERRRSLRDVLAGVFQRGDEGYRAEQRRRREETKAAQERLAERERYGALSTTMPEDTSAALPEAPDTAAMRALDAELAKLDTLPADQREEARAKLLGARFTGISATAEPTRPIEVEGRGPTPGGFGMAAQMARDEDLVKLLQKPIAFPQQRPETALAGTLGIGVVSPDYADLVGRYDKIKGLKATNQELYTTELRKIADEARRRMATARDLPFKPMQPPPGSLETPGMSEFEETSPEALAKREAEEKAAREARAATPGRAPAPVSPAVQGGPKAPVPAPVVAPPAAEAAPPPTAPTPTVEERPAPPVSPEMQKQVRDLPTYAQSEARRKVLEGVIRPQPKLGPRRDTIMPTAPSPADIEASRGPVRRDEKKEPINQPANIEFSPGLGGANEALFFSMPGGPEAYMQRLREAAKKSSSKLPMFSSYVNGGK